MMAPLTLSYLAHRFGGTLWSPDAEFAAVSTDSRELQRGELFVALRGDRFDGHQFLSDLADRACGAVVDTPDRALSLPQWVVADTVVALGQIARCNRERFRRPVIAITGSSGKTTVKEMLASILGRHGEVLVTYGNLNNHIGVPLTLLRLSGEHRYAVVEMGASAAGEIASYCHWAEPDIALVNNVAPAHLQGFGSVEGVARAKGEIYQGLSARGIAIINRDEPFADDWLQSLAGRTVFSYGLGNDMVDVRALAVESLADGCCRFRLWIRGESAEVTLTIPGRHNVMNALAAACCAFAAGVALADIAAGLSSAVTVPGRMRVLGGLRGARVVDDSYNANPGSVRAAIDTLAQFPGRRLLVLGDMGELGDSAVRLHADIGSYARERGIDELWTVGPLSAAAAAAFGSDRHFDDRTVLADVLAPLLDDEMTVLVKGSRSAGMEAVVAALTEEKG